MSLYVYCVTGEIPDLNVTGLQNHPVSVLKFDKLRIVVSDFIGGELKASKDNVFAHERVVVSAMSHATPLPFRFGTVVSEDKLRSFVEANAKGLLADLENVQECVEMGLKVLMPIESPEEPPQVRTGTEFLKMRLKRQEHQKQIAGWIDTRLEGRIRQTDSSIMAGTDRTIVRIAHLVTKYHLSDYKVLVDLLVQERTDLAFLRSGPWPPYSFITTPRLS